MRKLADAADAKEARAIVDALLVEGITATTRSHNDTEVWLEDDDELAAATRLVQEFRDGGIPDAAKRAAAIRAENERSERAGGTMQDFARARGWRAQAMAGLGVLTTFLIAGSVVIGTSQWLTDSSGLGMWNLTIDHWQSITPLERIRDGEVWRLITPIFLHFGLFHLGFNMLWLHRLGNQIEQQHGSLTLLALVVTAAVAGNLGQYFATGPAFGGMSGIVYCLFGFIWMHSRFDRRSTYVVGGTETVLLMVWFIACATGWFGPIANIGHAGGLVVGLLAGLPVYVRHAAATRDRHAIQQGSWEDVHLTGFRRFRRRWITPYAPAWFLGIAAVTIGAEFATVEGTPRANRQACSDYATVVATCFERLPDEESRQAFMREVEEIFAPLATGEVSVTEVEIMCAESLPATKALAASFGCGD